MFNPMCKTEFRFDLRTAVACLPHRASRRVRAALRDQRHRLKSPLSKPSDREQPSRPPLLSPGNPRRCWLGASSAVHPTGGGCLSCVLSHPEENFSRFPGQRTAAQTSDNWSPRTPGRFTPPPLSYDCDEASPADSLRTLSLRHPACRRRSEVVGWVEQRNPRTQCWAEAPSPSSGVCVAALTRPII